MAEKGMNLNPGADPTLVGVAYKAAMANVPHDLSGTYEALAKSYDETMKSVAESWSGVIEDVVKLGGAAIATAVRDMSVPPEAFSAVIDREEGPLTEKESAKSGEAGWSITTDPSDDPTSRQKAREDSSLKTFTIGDELVDIRKNLRKLWGKTDRASRIERNKLKTSRTKLFSELEVLQNADNFNNKNLASALIDNGATGTLPLLMQNALSAYKTKSGKILPGTKGMEKFAGYHVGLTRDANDDLNFILKDSQGRVVTGQGLDGEILTEAGGKPYSISTKKLTSLLTPKYDEKRRAAYDKLFTDQMASNSKIFGSGLFGNRIRDFVPTEEDLHGLIGRNPGDHISNLVDELNLGGPAAAELFGGINQARLKKLGIDDMADGTKGYSASDFIGKDGSTNIKNYKIVKDALLNRGSDNYDFKTTQNVFVKYATKVAGDMHKFTGGTDKPKGTEDERDIEGFVNQVKQGNSVINLGDDVFKRADITGVGSVYYTLDDEGDLAIFSDYELQASHGGRFARTDIGGGKTLSNEQRETARNALLKKGVAGDKLDAEALTTLIGTTTDDNTVKGKLQTKNYQYKGNNFKFSTKSLDGNYVTVSIKVDDKPYKKTFSTKPLDKTALAEFLNDPTIIQY